jgi:hypothetical protein
VAYRADIEIAVKGAQELKRLQDQLSATSKLVDGLNNYLENIGDGGVVRSIQNLNKTVADTAEVFNKAALGTDEAATAARNFLTANRQLTQGLEERLVLLKSITEEERRQRLGAVGIRETTQYDGPIGPGPASPVGSLVGQKSPVEERIRRTIDARRDELALEEALLRLEEKSAAIANKELQARGEIARLSAQGVNAATFRATQTSAPLALPSFQERGLQLLDDSVRLNESSRRIEQAVNGERQRGVRFLEKQTAEEARQVQLGILGQRTNQLTGGRTAPAPAPSGGFPVSGPMASPGFGRTQKQVGKFGENLALGAGFPLLFGGGPGTVAGSVLGSFVGSGFGGQILGGAIGQILDQAIQKTAQLGTALQTLDLSKIEESGIRINANLETQVNLVREAGDAYAAQQLLQQEVFAITGAIPGTVQGISDSVNILSSAWGEFTATAGVTLGIIGAPFAVALGAIIKAVNLIVKGFNVAASALGGLIQKTGEWVVEFIAGEEALKNIQDYFTSLNGAIDEARAKYAPILSDLNSQVLLNRQLLELEKQKTTGNDAGGKDRNADLTAQQKILTINAEIDSEIREINKGITEATKNQVDEAVRLLNVKRNQKIEEVQIESSLQRQRLAEDARDKAAREAAKAREDAQRAFEKAQRDFIANEKEIRSLTNQVNSVYLEQLDVQNSIVAFTGNEIASINQELGALDKILDTKKAILENDRQSALLSADNSKQITLINELFERRLDLLVRQQSLNEATLRKRFNVLVAGPVEAERSLLPIQEEINLLNAKILGQEKEYTQRVAIDELIKKGVGVEQATAEIQVRDQLIERLEKQKQLEQQTNDILNQMGTTTADVFQQLIFSTDSWRDSLSNALKSLSNILFQAALSGLAGTDGKGFFSFLTGTLGKRAAGGPVTGGTPYIVGERGPELFVPGRSGTIVPNDQMGGGGEVNVVVNVDAKGSNVAGNDQDANQLGRVISAAVQSELIKQQRPGGLLTR